MLTETMLTVIYMTLNHLHDTKPNVMYTFGWVKNTKGCH